MKTRSEGLPFQSYLKSLYRKFHSVKEGNPADYIPELAKVDANAFGISLITTDGHLQEVGKTQSGFTIQSISKPFIYGLILEDLGVEGVKKKVNVEPSGDAFNSISLEPGTGRPVNPMINAGAITVSSCVQGKNSKDRFERILNTLSTYAGRNLMIDVDVYESEKRTGHRNRAIAHMLRNFDVVKSHPEVGLDLYFRQCSTIVTCNDLAMMACTLANDGINPLTGQRALSSEYVPLVLSVMSLCGMYDYSGRWIYEVGMPAKSGVGGGIIVVLPGQFGLAVYSPRLDSRGNSVRGTLVCRQLAEDFGLHLLRIPKVAQTVIRSTYTLENVHSKRVRSWEDIGILEDEGKKSMVFELQGEMHFSTAEVAVRAIWEIAAKHEFILIDFRRVPSVDAGGSKLLEGLMNQIHNSTTCRLVFVIASRKIFNFSLEAAEKNQGIMVFNAIDNALEWCETQILLRLLCYVQTPKIPLEENELCKGMSEAQVKELRTITKKVRYKAGDIIIRGGDVADSIFFLIYGDVSVRISHSDSNSTRIATFSGGMFFGEIALLGRNVRTADVVADTVVECHILSVETIERLQDLQLKVHLLENLAKRLVKILLQHNVEVSQNAP